MICRIEYESRLKARQESLARLAASDDRLANVRTLAFLLAAGTVWMALGSWQSSWLWLLPPAAGFLVAVICHASVRRRIRDMERAIGHYQQRLDQLEGKRSSDAATGAAFLEPEHPYAADLDLFGQGSLFQLLASPITTHGAQTLADWLAPGPHQALPSADDAGRRQQAVAALAEQLDLRERLAVIGATPMPAGDVEQLDRWLSRPDGFTAPWVRPTATGLGLLGLAALGVWLATGTMSWLLLVAGAEWGFLQMLRGPWNSIKQHSERAADELNRIVQVIRALESAPAEGELLRQLHAALAGELRPASATIQRLERLVGHFQSMRRNLMIAPLAFISLMNVQQACAIDRWRAAHGPRVDDWLAAVGQLEALLAFSYLHYENPSYSFPQLSDDSSDGSPHFSAQQLAHPLLPADEVVANDVELSDSCRMLLVSGSNMSGKSTLMRSVGVNAVLAWAGAPVCAQRLSISRLQVAAAMRVQDSLQAGTSHFFAELKRIRMVIELAERGERFGPPVLFLLDEVLHGTNSHDRLAGARGVIRSLLSFGSIGLVTTHDLALCDLADEVPQPIRNIHFRDEWIDGKMVFHYQMHDGPVPKSNALSLMRLLGIDV